jgi:hypothetical protein
MRKRFLPSSLIVALAALLSIIAVPTHADTVFNLNTEFSGATAPPGPGPWVRFTFHTVSTGTVELTIDNLLAAGANKIGAAYFNISESFVPTAVAVTNTGGVASSAILRKIANPLSSGPNASPFKADGDGFFDFRIDLPTSSNTFGGGQSSKYKLTAPGLTDASFNFSSEPGGGNGSYHAAVHMQGLGADGRESGWLGDAAVVPLPAAAWMGMSLLGGVGGVGFFRRRRLVEA